MFERKRRTDERSSSLINNSMRLRELTNNIHPYPVVNEAWYSAFGIMRGIIMLLGVEEPVRNALSNIEQIKSQHPNTNEQIPLINHELGVAVSKIAGTLLASKVLGKTANVLKLSNLVKGSGSGLAKVARSEEHTSELQSH